jgi:hypothetical protein
MPSMLMMQGTMISVLSKYVPKEGQEEKDLGALLSHADQVIQAAAARLTS